MRLVLIGDVHVYRLWMPPWAMLGKPLLGQMNLWFNRSRHVDLSLLEPTLRHAAALTPDHVLLSGDLTTTAREKEFADIAGAVRRCLGHVPVVAVPGNHDRYTHTAVRRRRMERWFAGMMPGRYPNLSRLGGGWSLLALDASHPSAFNARGSVGAAQLEEASRLLSGLQEDEGVVVLSHYPFVLPQGREDRASHRLVDASAVGKVLGHCAARVVYLHGHVHEPWVWQWNPHGTADVWMVNAGAPLLRSLRHPYGQGFWQIDLPDDPRGEIRLLRHVIGGADNQGGLSWREVPVP